MKKQPTVLAIAAKGIYMEDVEKELRFEFPHINRLSITEGNGTIFVSWIARKYRRSHVEKFLAQLQKRYENN